ncbi:9373_t:CDS:2 [Entrophospora sp. SA101]|nr:9373_t:CDS:2 [Entrophospora sp. SA101]
MLEQKSFESKNVEVGYKNVETNGNSWTSFLYSMKSKEPSVSTAPTTSPRKQTFETENKINSTNKGGDTELINLKTNNSDFELTIDLLYSDFKNISSSSLSSEFGEMVSANDLENHNKLILTADLIDFTKNHTSSSTTTNIIEIVWLFVLEYYAFLNKQPSHLHWFMEINEKIESLKYKNCKVIVTNVDCQASNDNGILIQVVDFMSNNDDKVENDYDICLNVENPTLQTKESLKDYPSSTSPVETLVEEDISKSVFLESIDVSISSTKTDQSIRSSSVSEQPQQKSIVKSITPNSTTQPVIQQSHFANQINTTQSNNDQSSIGTSSAQTIPNNTTTTTKSQIIKSPVPKPSILPNATLQSTTFINDKASTKPQNYSEAARHQLPTQNNNNVQVERPDQKHIESVQKKNQADSTLSINQVTDKSVDKKNSSDFNKPQNNTNQSIENPKDTDQKQLNDSQARPKLPTPPVKTWTSLAANGIDKWKNDLLYDNTKGPLSIATINFKKCHHNSNKS